MNHTDLRRNALLLALLLLFSWTFTACGVVSRTTYPPGSGGSSSPPAAGTASASDEPAVSDEPVAEAGPEPSESAPESSASESSGSPAASSSSSSSSSSEPAASSTEPAAPAAGEEDYSADFVQQELFRAHEAWRGTPYILGGSSERGVDCSSFIQIVFDRYFGMSLPRSTREQLREGREVRRSSFRPGDLVFFRTSRRSLHVGIIVNQREFLHASTSSGVMISNLDERYWSSRFLEARRVLDEESFLGYSEN